MEEMRSELTGEEFFSPKDNNKEIKRLTIRIWIPNIAELKDENMKRHIIQVIRFREH